MRIPIALLCSWTLMSLGSALADEPTCAGIKRALVHSNLAVMRIERGPLPLAPVQASIAIGQMTALAHLAQFACNEEDAGKIDSVVTPRVEALQRLLPAGPVEAEPLPAPDAAAADSLPPAPPPRPPSTASARQPARGSVSASSCTRIYYMKGGHQFWRCKR